MVSEQLCDRIRELRAQFQTLVGVVRADLHRYCARMTGSVVDGEDIVQDTLARAFYALPELEDRSLLRPWLFQMAHNRAIDFQRRYDRNMRESLDDVDADADALVAATLSADEALARQEAVRAALSRFMNLVPVQRSCVILKDVLGHSVDEISRLLSLNVPATKAALHRGRVRLRELSAAETGDATTPAPASSTIARYASLFNAHDWEGVRAMLADDVRLEVVSRLQRSGRTRVGSYFTNYEEIRGWHFAPVWVDGREVLGFFRGETDSRPRHFVELRVADGYVLSIRDFLHVDYILRDAVVRRAS